MEKYNKQYDEEGFECNRKGTIKGCRAKEVKAINGSRSEQEQEIFWKYKKVRNQ